MCIAFDTYEGWKTTWVGVIVSDTDRLHRNGAVPSEFAARPIIINACAWDWRTDRHCKDGLCSSVVVVKSPWLSRCVVDTH